jgi:hypothetical protein
MGTTRVQRASLVAFILCMSIGFTSTPLSAAPLPNCSRSFSGIMKPVEKAVRAAVVKYYAIKKLGPITIYKNREQVVEVKLWTVGVHWCLNAPGSKGSYVGAVPKAALSAVEVYVFHKPYPNPVASNFLVLAKMQVKGWIVVAENTSP